MKEKINEFFNKKRYLSKEKPRYYHLNFYRTLFAILFFIVTMLPFFSASFLSTTTSANVFTLKASFVYFIAFLAIPFLIAFFAITENEKNLTLIVKAAAIIQGLFFLLMIIVYASDSASSSILQYKLNIGFYLMLLLLIGIIITAFYPVYSTKLLVKVFRIDQEDAIDEEDEDDEDEEEENQ